MKPYLTDVPVKTNIWTRPECQKKQFQVLKEARPRILFLISDGGRNQREWELIRQNRKLYEDGIDWECQVYQLYEESNRGLYEMIPKVHDFIWSRVDRCIFMEDDVLPSVSFFGYCEELLETYKDDPRISVICGMNHLGTYEDTAADYFFSRQGSIWGIATWKRTAELFYDISYGKDAYTMRLLRERMKHNKIFWKRTKGYAFQNVYEGHVPGDEFYFGFCIYSQNQVQIIPKVNLVSNIGCVKGAAHANDIRLLPHGIRRVFNMERYELLLPLKHPKYVIPDVGYEKKRNRIMAYNHPLILCFRKIETLFLNIIYGNFYYILRKAKEKIFTRAGKFQEK